MRMVAISAPAVASNFPDTYLRVQGWLKRLGVSAIFDVSFGAELRSKSTGAHPDATDPRPSSLSLARQSSRYIELYKPELMPYLAPADSPMVHTIKMIREYYPQYRP